MLPSAVIPKTIVVEPGTPYDQTKAALEQSGIQFPLIAKPDIGERGFLVKKIGDEAALQAHLSRYPVRFIVQEFLTLPLEASVLYHVFPGKGGEFDITSICIKEFLSVRGDGNSTIRQLMKKEARAAFQVPRFEKEFPEILEKIPKKDENMLLEPIGNHCRGTRFLNGNKWLTPGMHRAFQAICSQINGVYYARFDLKSASPEALQRGEFKVMELNGVFGEPAHIYDPKHGMLRAYRDLWQHWKILFRLHRALRAAGHGPTSHREAMRIIRSYFTYKKWLK
ncbi:MAG: hypothetical protein SFV22_16450 [Saprospiraceae bacterium]|nr:hypothetical protein [Saprospiraceae bacterium]